MENKRKIFSQIYDDNVDRIYRFIVLKVNSTEIAEDLTSEAFLKGWEAFKESSNPGLNKQNYIENPRAFLYRIARNLVTDHYRQKGRTQVISTEYASIIDPHSNIEEMSAVGSDLYNIKSALNKLNDDYKEVVIWHYLEDLSVPEIAKILDKSEGAVRVTIHRALKALKEEVKEA